MADHIQELVRGADRARRTTALERDRIRTKAFDDAAIGESVVIDAHEWERSRRPGRRSWAVLGGVAASIVLLALVIGFRSTDEAPHPAATVPPPTTPEQVRQICDTKLPPLTDALVAWGSVSDWAFSQNPDPDIGPPLMSVLRELDDLDQTMGDAADAVEAALLAVPEDQSAPSRAAYAELDRVSTAALTDALATLRRLDPQRRCDASAIESALR